MHRPWLMAWIALSLLTAGCLAGGQQAPPLESASTPGNGTSPGSEVDGNATHDPDDGQVPDEQEDGGGNQTAANGTRETNETAGSGDGNASTTTGPIDPGWPALSEAVIRPGVAVVARAGDHPANGTPASGIEEGWRCTASFVFTSPDNRTLYLGTTARCIEHLSLGDPVDVANGTTTGTLVYDSFRVMSLVGEANDTIRAANDLALIELPDEARPLVHPAVRHWGGPTGLAQGVSQGDHVLSVGESWYREEANQLDPAEGIVAGAEAWTATVAWLPPRLSVDTGSPVLSVDGAALGTVTSPPPGSPAPGDPDETGAPEANGVLQLAPALAYLEEHTSLEVVLATWPTLEAPQLPSDPAPPG